MPTFIKSYLVPIFTVLINGILAYFINQLPGFGQITGLPNTSIFTITVICVAALCLVTFAAQTQQDSTAGNINSPSQGLQSNVKPQFNWIGGFLLFLLGIVLYGLLQLNIIPKQSSIQFGYISLILCGFGAIVPSFLLIPKWWQNILLLLFSGIGFFLSFHYFSVANLNAAFTSFIFTLISIILLAARDFLVQVIRNVAIFWEDLQNQQAIEFSQLIKNSLEDLISPFKRNYYKALEYKCRDDETQGLDNERTLELQKVFVQLKIAANNASNIRQNMIPSDISKLKLSEITIWDCLAARDDKGNGIYKRLVILGRPGSGKTTLLRHLTLIYATKQQQTINRETPKLIPVLFYLREIREIIISENPPLETLVKQQIEKIKINNQYLAPQEHWVKKNLQHNKFIIMLDGLDEVADKNQRQKVRTWVDKQMDDYPDTVFILTSRPNGYKELQSKISVDELEVQPFDRKQITDFLQLWYLQAEIKSRPGQYDEGVKQVAEKQANNLINRIINSSSLVAMAINPLLLKMIATVHRRGNVLPGKRAELYKDICQILLEKRQRAKNIDDGLTASQKQSILQELALRLMLTQTREFTLSDADKWISRQLKTLPKLNKTEEFIKHIRDDCALLIEKEICIYEFAHLSFQEYLAAIEIKE
ncbi:MAG: NACHT domain-containing protein [Nostocaceae cyanobacterium]|nr:NACHT domain-containing protein [Nostocaceae cyanobacterium]